MSKFEVLVVLPPTPPDRYREELAARLAPYRSELEVPEYRARASALSGYVLLRMDGSWSDIRRRGDSVAYWQETNDHLDALDPDAVVLAVSCHS
ncbi:hypothetical protein ACWEO1_22950 [Kitasatospora cineracea]